MTEKIIQLNEGAIKHELKELVRSSAEETLNKLLEQEASELLMFIGDRSLGLLEAVTTVYPQAKYQRCTVHFYRNMFSVTPLTRSRYRRNTDVHGLPVSALVEDTDEQRHRALES